jgi:MFS transporter, DHA2 family, multidrug resistance protein
MSELTPFQKGLLFVALALATFMIVLDYSIANVSIPYISGALAVSNEQGTYVITSFAVGNAIGLAMTGWLTKRIGAVKLVVLSVVLFTFFSWVCGMSVTLLMLTISRFIQGLVAGPVIPLSQSLILTQGSEKSRGRDLAIWSTIVIAAPVLGPILGGYISDWYVWSWIFYINIPVGIFCAAAIWAVLRQHETATSKVPGDIPAIVWLVIGVSCLQVFLDKGQQWDWLNSEKIWLLIIGTVVAFTYLIIRELGRPKPLLDLSLFRSPSFTLSIICLMVSYAIYFGTIVLVPLWLQEYMGYTAEWAGFAVCTLGIGPVFLTLLTPKIAAKIGYEWTFLISLVIFCISCFVNAFFTTAVDLFHIALLRFFFGLGFMAYISPLLTISIRDVPVEKLPSATGIFHFVRAMFGGVGTSVFTTLWIRRTIFHHERVGASLTPFNPFTPPDTGAASLEQLNASLDQQAALLALNDAFYLMGWIFAGLIVLLVTWNLVQKKPQVPREKTQHVVD